jgi:predicted amino acid racemase
MAFIQLNRSRLQDNFNFLNKMFKSENIEWAIVTKLLCGNELYLKEVLSLGIKEVCDARISNLKTIKRLSPQTETVYIKPPAKRIIKSLVKYADASFNTEFETIKLISEEAQRQNKSHKIIIMIELGDLREGVMGEELISFYKSVFELPNIEVTGIGANLNCLHGVMPSTDKLIQLSLYKQLIEATFERKISWVTGGTSVVVPLLFNKVVPVGINHFRIGEMLFFGNNLVTGLPVEELHQRIFSLFAEIVEITDKPKVPTGELDQNPSGEMYEVNEQDYGKSSFRAIVDFGLLDVNTDFIKPDDEDLIVGGASSDMLVIDLGENPKGYKVGDLLSFEIKYMGALHLLNSGYIGKEVV